VILGFVPWPCRRLQPVVVYGGGPEIQPRLKPDVIEPVRWICLRSPMPRTRMSVGCAWSQGQQADLNRLNRLGAGVGSVHDGACFERGSWGMGAPHGLWDVALVNPDDSHSPAGEWLHPQ